MIFLSKRITQELETIILQLTGSYAESFGEENLSPVSETTGSLSIFCLSVCWKSKVLDICLRLLPVFFVETLGCHDSLSAGPTVLVLRGRSWRTGSLLRCLPKGSVSLCWEGSSRSGGMSTRGIWYICSSWSLDDPSRESLLDSILLMCQVVHLNRPIKERSDFLRFLKYKNNET